MNAPRGLSVALCLSRTTGSVLAFSLLICIPALAAADVVRVGPPSGGDDTTTLQAALDECMTNHPEGCTVQLSAGTYKSTQLIAESFHGSLKGMGMGKTTIQALPFLDVTAGRVGEGFFDENPPSRSNKYPMLIMFQAGDITVSDMTLEVTAYEPVAKWCYSDLGCDWRHVYGLLAVIGTSANLLVERVGFEGGAGTLAASGHNYDNGPCYFGLGVGAPLTGTFRVVSSRVRNGEDSLLAWNVRHGQVIIGGSPSEGNVVDGGAIGGAFFDFDDSVLKYSHNDVSVSPWGGVFAWQGGVSPEKVPRFLIERNTFKVTGAYADGFADGVLVGDLGLAAGLGKTADFLISQNSIEVVGSESGPAWAGIEELYGDGAVISNNRIRGGNVLFGIAAEANDQCMLHGNNLQGLRPLWAPVGLMGLSLGLPDTTDCTVVGGNNKTNVYDEGFNNTLVGVNNMRGNPPGPAIRDAMKRKMEMLKSIRRQ